MLKKLLATVAVLGLVGVGSVLAQTGPAVSPPATAAATPPAAATQPPAEPATTAPALTREDLKPFLDGIMTHVIGHDDIAGATIVVVKDGQILYTQGYGVSDLKTHAPVIPDKTMFRPGSVSKLFTWTAVMQQVEQGKIDLDKDLNTYLDFKIPEKFGKPITMRNCMTHSAGFEESVSELFVDKPEQMYPLRDYLIKHMPDRIYPPGKVVAYSNYCTTVAGYIVQHLSGELFDVYISNHILKPLKMDSSSFSQPLPKALQPQMSKGYKLASSGEEVPFELVLGAPAGSLSSTATDMARFMMAHLADGTLDGVQILQPETAKYMHRVRQMTLAPGLNGFNLGFYDEDRNGHRIVGHGGDTIAFHSDLHLMLDDNVGFFLSFNGPGKDGATGEERGAIFREFLDRYFPHTVADEAAVKDPSADNARVVGSYQSSRRKDTMLSLLWKLGPADVTAKPDGTIQVSALKDFSGAVKSWKNVGPLTYREVGGPAHLKFVTDANGDIDYWTTDDFIPVFVFQRLHGLEQSSLLKPLGSAFIAILVLTLVIWFGGWIIRRRFGRPLELTPQQGRLRLASRLGAALMLLVLVGWFGLITVISTDESLLLGGKLNPVFILLYVIGVLALLGGIAMVVNGALRAVRGPGGWLVRIGEVALLLAGLYGIWGLIDFGLINFHTNL